MKKTHAALIGFLAAPLIAALLGVALTPLGKGLDAGLRFGLLPIFYFFSLLAALFFGVPLFLLLWRLNIINWWTSFGAGAASGVLVAATLRLPDVAGISEIVSMAPIGAAAALGFYWIWRRARD